MNVAGYRARALMFGLHGGCDLSVERRGTCLAVVSISPMSLRASARLVTSFDGTVIEEVARPVGCTRLALPTTMFVYSRR
jgi:hypothetical protein